MDSRPMEEVVALEERLADLYIMHGVERDLHGYYGTNGRIEFKSGYNYTLSKHTTVIDPFVFDTYYADLYNRMDRCLKWKRQLNSLREAARQATLRRCRPQVAYRRYASARFNNSFWQSRQDIAARVRGAIKEHGNPRGVEESPQLYNQLYNMFTVVPYDVLEKLNPVSLKLRQALAENAYRLDSGKWQLPVWVNEPWYSQSKWRAIHATHVSEVSAVLLAYTQNGDKLVRDIQTQVKPGRYLQQFFSDVLSEKDIRYWAERQQATGDNSDFHIVPNTDPDGWEWVYENASGFNSCMMYNHPHSRYLHSEAYGKNHPVRMYACKHNNLALAYIGSECKSEGGRVYGRAIVNTETMGYVRVYGDSRIEHVLKLKGYTYDSGCLNGELLIRKGFDGGYLMPYLDGNYTNVEKVDQGGKDLWRIGDDGCDGQNSSGVINGYDEDCYECSHCGEMTHEDDLYSTYDGDGGSVCSNCIGDHYVWAVGRRGTAILVRYDDAVFCESDKTYYYTYYLNSNDIYECEISGSYYHIDDLCHPTVGSYADQSIHCDYLKELPDGETCYEGDYDELLADHGGDVDEEDDSPITDAQPDPSVMNVSVDFHIAA